MVSTVVELVGFGLLTIAAFISFGVGAGLAVAGVCCLVVGYLSAGLSLRKGENE